MGGWGVMSGLWLWPFSFAFLLDMLLLLFGFRLYLCSLEGHCPSSSSSGSPFARLLKRGTVHWISAGRQARFPFLWCTLPLFDKETLAVVLNGVVEWDYEKAQSLFEGCGK